MSLASLFAPGEAASNAVGDRGAALWVAALALVLFLPGFVGLPVMDRDEARFAQATKQMIETRDYVDIRFQSEARNKKPIGIYWLQAAAVEAGAALGVPDALRAIWLYRIPSLIGAVATALLTYWTGRNFMSTRAAALSSMLLASTVLLGVEARLATTDAALAATTVAAMGALAQVWLRREDSGGPSLAAPAIFWTAIGLGILIKGPITPMIAALAAIALCAKERSARWLLGLRPLVGLVWAALLAAPWLVLITLRTHGAFLRDSIGGDMLAKAASAKEAHGAPPGTYFAAFWATGWPMASFAALAAPAAWRHRREPETAFLLAWLVPAWVLFEIVPTKLPHYVLPLYPSAALLVGLAFDRGRIGVDALWRRIALFWVPALASLGLIGLFAFAALRGLAPTLAAVAAAPLLVWRAIVFIRGGGGLLARIGDSLLIALLFFLAVYDGFLVSPAVADLLMTPSLIAARDAGLRATGCPRLAAATTSYREPSLVFLAGTDLRMTDAAGAARFLAAGPCRIAFVGQGDEKAFAQALPSQAGAPSFRRVRAFNASRGRMMTVDVWTRGR